MTGGFTTVTNKNDLPTMPISNMALSTVPIGLSLFTKSAKSFGFGF